MNSKAIPAGFEEPVKNQPAPEINVDPEVLAEIDAKAVALADRIAAVHGPRLEKIARGEDPDSDLGQGGIMSTPITTDRLIEVGLRGYPKYADGRNPDQFVYRRTRFQVEHDWVRDSWQISVLDGDDRDPRRITLLKDLEHLKRLLAELGVNLDKTER